MTREQLIKVVAKELCRETVNTGDHTQDSAETIINRRWNTRARQARAILALIESHAVIVPIEPGEGEIEAMAFAVKGWRMGFARQSRASFLAYKFLLFLCERINCRLSGRRKGYAHFALQRRCTISQALRTGRPPCVQYR